MTTTHRLTFEQVKGGRGWSKLEQALLNACKLGRDAYLPGKQDCPKDQSDPDRRVRPTLIRYLLEGGCENGVRPHPKGVTLLGAWIDGVLDCVGCVTLLDLALFNCLFEQRVIFRDARLGALYLSGSLAKQGVSLHRLRTEKSVHLRAGFHAKGPVDLGGSRIEGALVCSAGRFDGVGGKALNCIAARIGADVFLHEGFHATGEVSLVGAVVEGQLVCGSGRFDGGDGTALNCDAIRVGADVFLRGVLLAKGRLNFTRAQITGNLMAQGAHIDGAMELDSAQIGSGFCWEDIKGTVPILNLTEAKVGTLVDDAASWEQVEELHLSGFRYDHIQSDMGISDRLAWLVRKHERPLLPDMRQSLSHQPWLGPRRTGFDPQPYSQLAKVLEADGNRMGAARVLAEREDRLRAVEQLRAFGRLDGSARAAFGSVPALLRQGWNAIFKYVFGYGHHPARALVWMLGIWGLGFVLYGSAYASGQMVPNSDVILTSADWLAAATPYFDGSTDIRPAIAWADTPAGKDYETFSAALYALDLFVPLDALGQETTWAPSRAYGWLGTIAYWARMPIQLSGWIITAVGAAVLTGLIGRKE